MLPIRRVLRWPGYDEAAIDESGPVLDFVQAVLDGLEQMGEAP